MDAEQKEQVTAQLFSLMKKFCSIERKLCPIQTLFRMLQISLLNRSERWKEDSGRENNGKHCLLFN